MQYDHIYNSAERTIEGEVTFDYEKDIPVTVLFEKENVVLKADAHGNAVFYDLEGQELHKDKANGKNNFFSRVYFCVKSDGICVRFPIIEWIDHYPNCDGEYDRWSERIVDNVYITYLV